MASPDEEPLSADEGNSMEAEESAGKTPVAELKSGEEAVGDTTKRDEDGKSLISTVLKEDTSILVPDDSNVVAWTAVVSKSADVVVWLDKTRLSLVEIEKIGLLVKLEDVLSNAGSILKLFERLPSVDGAIEVDGSAVEMEPTEEAESIAEELDSPNIEL